MREYFLGSMTSLIMHEDKSATRGTSPVSGNVLYFKPKMVLFSVI